MTVNIAEPVVPAANDNRIPVQGYATFPLKLAVAGVPEGVDG
jgi:hypothetical protein